MRLTMPSVTAGALRFCQKVCPFVNYRVTSINGPFTDDTIAWSYQDAARQVTRTAPGAITQTSTVDAYGRMISVANQLGIFTNTYASIGGPLTAITHTGANAYK